MVRNKQWTYTVESVNKTGMLFCEAKNRLGNDSVFTAVLLDDDSKKEIKIYFSSKSSIAVGSEVEIWCFSKRFEHIYWENCA